VLSGFSGVTSPAAQSMCENGGMKLWLVWSNFIEYSSSGVT
jgi:hypothetical protein